MKLPALLISGALVAAALTAPAIASASEESPAVGDCLVVEKGTVWSFYGETSFVACDEAHESEVYEVIAYPQGEGAPSSIGERAWELFGEACSYTAFEDYLGTSSWKMPPRVYRAFRLPTDEQWEAGADWVLCTTVRPSAKGEPVAYSDTLPSLLADGPTLAFLTCLNKNPKSGKWNNGSTCTSKSKWLLISGVGFRAKVTGKYPKDVQKKADGMCAKNAKGLLSKKSKAFAALGPKEEMTGGEVYAECFIVLKDWNGKS